MGQVIVQIDQLIQKSWILGATLLVLVTFGCATAPLPPTALETKSPAEATPQGTPLTLPLSPIPTPAPLPHALSPSPTESVGDVKNYPTVELRMLELEAKVSGLNDKLELAKSSIADLKQVIKIQMGSPARHPADIDSGTPHEPKTSALNDPELGFIHDEAVQIFKRAMIQFQSQKYPESVLSFTEFLEQYRDHPLAGSAQYLISKAYLSQKEFKLAIQEYLIVLSQYDQSPHVSDAMKDLIQAENALGNTEQAQLFKTRLTTDYPQAPAANIEPMEHPS